MKQELKTMESQGYFSDNPYRSTMGISGGITRGKKFAIGGMSNHDMAQSTLVSLIPFSLIIAGYKKHAAEDSSGIKSTRTLRGLISNISFELVKIGGYAYMGYSLTH
jgi:hypothetical protein